MRVMGEGEGDGEGDCEGEGDGEGRGIIGKEKRQYTCLKTE